VFMCVCVGGAAGGGYAAIVTLCAHVWQDCCMKLCCSCVMHICIFIFACVYTHIHMYVCIICKDV
jgi:hypothetical protein